jgi:hypothetical protein
MYIFNDRKLFIVAALLIGFFSFTDVAQVDEQVSSSPIDDIEKTSVGAILTPDGHIDLEKAHLSRYQGSPDIFGHDKNFDPDTNKPVMKSVITKDHPDDVYWDNSISPSLRGVDGIVYTFIEYQGNLIIGGNFDVAGDTLANSIAAWDGSSWSPLGSGMGSPDNSSTVFALVVYEDKLVVGGGFSTAGGVSAKNIACWDGISWSPLGSGIVGHARTLTVYNNHLIAGGSFSTAGDVTAANIAAWDGSSWSPLGSGISSVPGYYDGVYALSVYDSQLIAGGDIDTAGSIPTNHIAAWDGSTWSSLGSGIMGDAVFALTVHNNRLIAGGQFVTAGDTSVNNIAAWDGSSWSSLGLGVSGSSSSYSRVMALAIYENKLVAGGHFTVAGDAEANNIATWDDSSWMPIGSGVGSYPIVNALTVYNNSLMAGGLFHVAGDVRVEHIAAWDGSSWSSLGSGTSAYVCALTVYNDRLIAAGSFATAGGVSANCIASWDGSSWSPLGTGIVGIVRALTVYDNRLIAGGYFDTAGNVTAHNIAAWDGSSWSPLGAGIGDYILDWLSGVHALTSYDNQLIAGGCFTTAGDVTANHIAAWDGLSWSSLGSGTGDGVLALTVYNNQLIAGGYFFTAGDTPGNNIAAWNGSLWSPLGSGLYGDVRVLSIYDDQLIAGGGFWLAEDVEVHRIAAWNGSSWLPLGSGVSGHYLPYPDVRALAIYNDRLMVGGAFTQLTGGDPASHVAAWDGSSWSQLGSGANGTVSALTFFDGKLIVGGYFTIAGSKASAYVAQWTKGSPTAVGDNDIDAALPKQVILSQNYPNPFNPSTTVEFVLHRKDHVEITIYNLLGQKVRVLVDEVRQAGIHQAHWDGRASNGQDVASGIYLYRLKTGSQARSKKMVLLR